jgi:23S rRNA pseudouridine2605 synthase
MRINRYLAAAGLGSRRACEQLVLEGKVTISGKKIDNLATEVAPGADVRVSGKPVKAQPSIYIIFNKPKGVLTTCVDPSKRRTVFDFLPPHLGRIFPVGRLDMDSRGLLILTNDGALMQELLHPSKKVEKEYEVRVDRPVEPECIKRLLKGFVIEGGRARMEKVHRIAPGFYRVVLTQGIKRQIRKMFYRLGYEVLDLRRVRVGSLLLGNLPEGHWRYITARELAALRTSTSGAAARASRAGKAKMESCSG